MFSLPRLTLFVEFLSYHFGGHLCQFFGFILLALLWYFYELQCLFDLLFNFFIEEKSTTHVATEIQNSRMTFPIVSMANSKKKKLLTLACVAMGIFIVGLRNVLFGGVAIYNHYFPIFKFKYFFTFFKLERYPSYSAV